MRQLLLQKLSIVLVVIAGVVLTACGGGGGGNSGDNSNADEKLTGDEFSSELAYAATGASVNVLQSEQPGLPVAFAVGPQPSLDLLIEHVNQFVDFDLSETAGLPLAATVVEEDEKLGDCGGSYKTTSTQTTPDNGDLFPISVRIEGAMTNYCIGEPGASITYDGSLVIEIELFQEFSSSSYRFNLNYESDIPFYQQSGSVNSSRTCTRTGSEPLVCTSESSFVSTRNITYNISNVAVTGNASSGYQLTGTLSDENGNSYAINVSGLTQCNDGNVETGSITVETSNGDVIEVTFPNCSECVVTYQGVSTTYPQDPQ